MAKITWKKVLNEVAWLNEDGIRCGVYREGHKYAVVIPRRDGALKTFHPANLECTWLFLQSLWK